MTHHQTNQNTLEVQVSEEHQQIAKQNDQNNFIAFLRS